MTSSGLLKPFSNRILPGEYPLELFMDPLWLHCTLNNVLRPFSPYHFFTQASDLIYQLILPFNLSLTLRMFRGSKFVLYPDSLHNSSNTSAVKVFTPIRNGRLMASQILKSSDFLRLPLLSGLYCPLLVQI